MKFIKRGEKAGFDGFILTDNEYDNYKKLLDVVSVFKSYKQDYERVYNKCWK